MKYKCDECEAEFYDYEMAPCFDYDFPAGCCPDCGSAELDELIMADECRRTAPTIAATKRTWPSGPIPTHQTL